MKKIILLCVIIALIAGACQPPYKDTGFQKTDVGSCELYPRVQVLGNDVTVSVPYKGNLEAVYFHDGVVNYWSGGYENASDATVIIKAKGGEVCLSGTVTADRCLMDLWSSKTCLKEGGR